MQQSQILQQISDVFSMVLADKHWVVHQVALQAFSTFAEVCISQTPYIKFSMLEIPLDKELSANCLVEPVQKLESWSLL